MIRRIAGTAAVNAARAIVTRTDAPARIHAA